VVVDTSTATQAELARTVLAVPGYDR
jgi:hypothetical protein